MAMHVLLVYQQLGSWVEMRNRTEKESEIRVRGHPKFGLLVVHVWEC
jgi:hypothetical protein